MLFLFFKKLWHLKINLCYVRQIVQKFHLVHFITPATFEKFTQQKQANLLMQSKKLSNRTSVQINVPLILGNVKKGK